MTRDKEPEKENIFSLNKRDGIMYFFFYVLIPVFVTYFSLESIGAFVKKSPETDDFAVVYCFVSILISVLNQFYDACNRWIGEKSIRNLKIIIMVIPSIIIAIYCISVILRVLLLKQINFNGIGWMLLYTVSVGVAIWDVIECLAEEAAWKSQI